ncbi:uncharacterized protein N7511_006715 [Penicillium nucicola]|uniref:uncharacterized protein n=1 Tax=Penicillium nucicola TaxID=1850975 RepID=UPI00254525C8|nr:uncharacterized protein N7511_006715 [Penicillium nucicola]KAJ5758021.1 hypothetical protein N7511_006715 [Penicillium nucicola]
MPYVAKRRFCVSVGDVGKTYRDQSEAGENETWLQPSDDLHDPDPGPSIGSRTRRAVAELGQSSIAWTRFTYILENY